LHLKTKNKEESSQTVEFMKETTEKQNDRPLASAP
jgi:hypothetical protein